MVHDLTDLLIHVYPYYCDQERHDGFLKHYWPVLEVESFLFVEE